VALSPPEKAAVIIGLLGKEIAGVVIDKLDDRHLRSFMDTLSNLDEVPQDSVIQSVGEFLRALEYRRQNFHGGPAYAESFLKNVLNKERGARLLQPASLSSGNKEQTVWHRLESSDVCGLGAFLEKQRPHVTAIVLQKLTPSCSSELLAEFKMDYSLDVLKVMSSGTEIKDAATNAVATFMEDSFLNIDRSDPGADSVGFISSVLGTLSKDRRDTLLGILDVDDPDKAKAIRAAMLTFEDLPARMPTTAVPILFKEYPLNLLVTALKAGDAQMPEVVAFLLKNISQRMAGQIREQIQEMKSLPQKDGDKALTGLVSFLMKLEKEGRISWIKSEAADVHD